MNEIVLYNHIEKRLKERREPTIFPLTPTHRKELRDLKIRNIGNLRERVSAIKSLKKEEFIKNNIKQIQKQVELYVNKVDELNKDWKLRIKKINELLQERRDIESKLDMNYFSVSNDYEGLAKLETRTYNRVFGCDVKTISLRIAAQKFEERYEKPFGEVLLVIEDISTKYEEAINFGDLEIVKELYYIMKNSETLFDKISSLKM